ncbi:Predicted N-acetyltransferase YhbS [Marinobacter sp. es.048]|uniref:GNAT family N-acetyltransferase n=1 Tax=Marinobacter sp. es.048 TaxID=1761795 RepID=UPI000B591FD0|nr:N-acetyltransferase [Marinobacter sp. es.048]SNC75527.1 Predicted N-acetyltransferase YhbS [Marinobacter sp. es.048]
MRFSSKFRGGEKEIEDLFTATFTDSEGPEEGALIGNLVRKLLTETAPDDIHVFLASVGEDLVGAAVFTRLTYSRDSRVVFLLSPMAVANQWQGKGVGQRLLKHALDSLCAEGVDVAITYGDPAFYGKVGFETLTESMAKPPLPLSQPEGWIGQSLTEGPLAALEGLSTCVAALNHSSFW